MNVKDAIYEVRALVERLPEGTIWAVTLTHDTEPGNAAAFNIWIDCDADRQYLRTLLGLGEPDWENEYAEEHEVSKLVTVSIIAEGK
jgi:hypothetical protein